MLPGSAGGQSDMVAPAGATPRLATSGGIDDLNPIDINAGGANFHAEVATGGSDTVLVSGSAGTGTFQFDIDSGTNVTNLTLSQNPSVAHLYVHDDFLQLQLTPPASQDQPVISVQAGIEVITNSTDPAAAHLYGAVLFARVNGSGKTELCVRFHTGAVQILATEP